MRRVTITKTQGAYRDFAQGAIKGHRFAIVVVAHRRALGPQATGPFAAARLPAAPRWSQVVSRQWAPLRMTGLPARVAV